MRIKITIANTVLCAAGRMISDLDAFDSPLPDYDLCVIGSGPAGMTVVHELAAAGLRIAVLESGLAKHTRHGERLREVVSRGIQIKPQSRERVLGGASTTWSGLSSPLDPIDLAPRPWLAHSGWPIDREQLLPYYAAAAERYRFPPPELYEPTGFQELKARGELQPSWERIEEKVFLAASEPQDFGREWCDDFERPGVDLWLDATVLELAEEGGAVREALLRTRGGKEARLGARAFVLATGGIENARLLLASGLGNGHDQVGRYLMNHPKNYCGLLRLARGVEELPYYFGCLHRGYAGYGGLRMRPEVQAQRGLLNSYVRLEPLFPWTDNRGVEALVLLVKRSKGLLRFWKKRREEKVVALRDYSETGDDSELEAQGKSLPALAGIVLVNLPRVLQYLYYRLGRAKPLIRRARLRNFMEMEPRGENRVTLSDELDVYGRPKPAVEHHLSDLDRRSLLALHETLAAEVEEAGLGRLESPLAQADPWPIDQDASHHMGTTRMGEDATTSVVDRDLALHGTRGLYLAGASVFPTSGCANPTFTIVALSVRLAEHLRREVLR